MELVRTILTVNRTVVMSTDVVVNWVTPTARTKHSAGNVSIHDLLF